MRKVAEGSYFALMREPLRETFLLPGGDGFFSLTLGNSLGIGVDVVGLPETE
jgi:hypothetical protein